MRYFDTHCDTILKAAENGSLAENAFEVDFRRLAQYDTAVQVFAVFNEGDFLCSDILQYVHMIQTQAESCEIARFADGYGSLVQNAGMVSCMASVEGLGNTPDFVLEQVDALYDAGVRMMSLTWNQDNPLCGGIENNQAGLTDMGRAVIQRMNEKKIAVDVSHASEAGFWDILACSERPVAATHSNARAVCGHPRNLTDAQMTAIAESGGVIGLNLYPVFLNGTSRADVTDMLRHLEHMVSVAGIDAVGIGADFDGIDVCPQDVSDCGRMGLLFAAMQAQGYSQEEIDKIAYGNWLSLFHKYE